MNKSSGGDGIPAEQFQILKRRSCESTALNMPANLGNSVVATGLEKVRFHPNTKERQSKNAQTIAQLHSSHTLAK